VENVDSIINVVLDGIDNNTYWNIEKHITLNRINDDFKISNKTLPIIGNDKKEITHIVLKSEMNSLNFWDTMIYILLERFLIYNPEHEKDKKKYENKSINTYLFLLNSNNSIKLDWLWDKTLNVEMKKEIKKAMILHFSDNHEEIYNYYCYVKNENDGRFFGGEHISKTPFQYIVSKINNEQNYPSYIIRVFEELHEKIVRGDKQYVKNICESKENFNKVLCDKLELACDNYLGISEVTDYDF
jgi:hypothetical protein